MDTRAYKIITVGLLILAVLIGLSATLIVREESTEASDADYKKAEEASMINLEAPAIDAEAFEVFKPTGQGDTESTSHQYRLAGTFFLMLSEGEQGDPKRMAIIDDIRGNKQYVVSEGDSFQRFEVLRIYKKSLVLRKGAEEMVLELSFASADPFADENAVEESDLPQTETYEASKYGKQIGERRWLLQKEAMNGYYRELLDNPERIAALYMSMKPDLLDGSVAGYRIEREGEEAFFDAVGLIDGDVIRKVNSMKMTSQARGEYFLSEFIQERLGAVVLDIEREGKEEKLIYLFR